LNRQLLRVYDLQPECMLLDSTTVSGHWRVRVYGLFQFGHSKDHRPDRPQVKVMLSALAPLGLPVATGVVPGQRADDPLDVPAITRMRARLGRRGLLSVGLRVLTLLELVVSRRLATERTVLAGLSAGNPKQPTARPTTARLWERFEGLTLTLTREGRCRRSHLTPLSRVQRRLLALLDCLMDITDLDIER
jgi:hypothetical protein